MTFYVCRDVTGRPAVFDHPASDDVVATFESAGEAEALRADLLEARPHPAGN